MPDSSVVKYLVKLRFEVEGVVERADLIGAIFGQTEGLFGPEMNLHELQKTWKVGRIEINLETKNGKTSGEVLIPMSTDISTAALIAAAVENVDKVGPCSARFQLDAIEDVRAVKRKVIASRAKSIIREWATKTTSEGEELLRDVMDSTKRARVISYGRDELPAGPGVYTSNTVIVVEGRADVINLLRAGFENVLGIEGTNVSDTVGKLSREKKLIAFLDGDRGGDLILKELSQVASLHRIVRAPPGKEVEDLTPVELVQLLQEEAPPAPRKEVKAVTAPQELVTKVKELYPQLNSTLEAVLLNEGLEEIARIPVSELVQRLESGSNVKYVVFDGIITQRLVDTCSKVSVSYVVGHRAGEMSGKPDGLMLNTFRELELE